jgi:hypothetical protein
MPGIAQLAHSTIKRRMTHVRYVDKYARLLMRQRRKDNAFNNKQRCKRKERDWNRYKKLKK